MGERGLVRSPYRSCMATLKDEHRWEAKSKALECEQEVGREGGGRESRHETAGGSEKSRGKGKQSRGKCRTEREGMVEREVLMGMVKGPEIPETKRRGREREQRGTWKQ